MYGLVQITPPTEEPVSLAEAKAWLRLDAADDDRLVLGLIATARAVVEQLYGRQLVTATWKLTLDRFPGGTSGWEQVARGLSGWAGYLPALLLPRPPLQSVSHVKYLDGAGVEQTLASTAYAVDAIQQPGRLALAYGQSWPVPLEAPGAVRITYVAGHGGAAQVPPDVKTALLMAVARLYERRGDEDGPPEALPRATRLLLDASWHGALEVGA